MGGPLYTPPGGGEGGGVTAQTLTDGATITCDWSLGEVATITLGGARTIAMSGGTAGRAYTLRIVQDGTGDRSLEYGSEVPMKPEHRRQAGQATVHQFVCDGAAYHLVGPSPWIWIPCTADTSHSVLATWVQVTGARFTPVASARYAVLVRLYHFAAALTTGLAARFTDAGATTGGGLLQGRSTSIGTTAPRWFAISDTVGVVGASTGSTTLGTTATLGDLHFAAPASPTQIGPEITTEVDGSAVTVVSQVSGIFLRRLS